MLNILGLVVQTPERSRHDNLLGARIAKTYYHLYDPAGTHSRPPTVRRGVTMKYAAPYEAPAAENGRSSADMASDVVGALLAALPESAAGVTALLHAQCTLDQQILRSPTLRVKHDHFRQSVQVMGIGQLGTSGVPTALRLVSGQSIDIDDGLACISACDKWIAPFVRRWPDLVTYADAAAACLVSRGPAHGAVAVIGDAATICRPPPHDLWTTPAGVQRAWLVRAVCDVVTSLLARAPRGQAFAAAGDGLGDELTQAVVASVSSESGVPIHGLPDHDINIHLASAAPLAAIGRGIAAASQSGDTLETVVWTASLAGHFAALRVRCRPEATRIPDGWAGAWTPPHTAAARTTSHPRSAQ